MSCSTCKHKDTCTDAFSRFSGLCNGAKEIDITEYHDVPKTIPGLPDLDFITTKPMHIKALDRKTNADMIRSMSDEELAVFLGKIKAIGYVFQDRSDIEADYFRHWLKQKAEEWAWRGNK